MATRYARGVGAHSGGLREVLNPWGKIAGSLSRQCGGAVGGAAWQKGAAVCLGTAQTRASTGSPVGIPRPRCPPSPPPGRRAQAGEGCLPSQAKHAVGALRARCGVCGVCGGSPWGAGEACGERGVPLRGPGKVRGPGRQSCPARAWLFLRRPAQAIATGTFPGSSGVLPEGDLRATSGPGGGGAAAARRGPRAAAALPHLGRSGPDRTGPHLPPLGRRAAP